MFLLPFEKTKLNQCWSVQICVSLTIKWFYTDWQFIPISPENMTPVVMGKHLQLFKRISLYSPLVPLTSYVINNTKCLFSLLAKRNIQSIYLTVALRLMTSSWDAVLRGTQTYTETLVPLFSWAMDRKHQGFTNCCVEMESGSPALTVSGKGYRQRQ